MVSFIHKVVVWGAKLSGTRQLLERQFHKNRVGRQKPSEKQVKRYGISASEYEDWTVYNFGALKDGQPILYYCHGGGFIFGMFDTYYDAIGKLAREAGMSAIAPDYPMPPEVDMPTMRKWAVSHFKHIARTYPNSPIIVAGDSAGANYALRLAQTLPKTVRKKVAHLFLLYPWTNLSRDPDDYTVHSEEALLFNEGLPDAAARFAGGKPVDHPAVSPVFGEMGDLPRTSVYSGDKDMLFPDAVELANKLSQAGALEAHNVAVGYAHDYWIFPSPDGKKALKELAKDIKSKATASA